MPKAKFYRRYPIQSHLGQHHIDRLGAYGPKLWTFFNRVNKAASTSVIATMATAKEGAPPSDIRKVKNTLWKRPSQLTATEVANIEDMFKFVFVRCPYTRILSCYLSLVVTNRIGCARADWTFLEFLQWLSVENNLYLDVHWAPQVDLFLLPEYDFIGRVERFDQDMRYVLSQIRTDQTEPVRAASVPDANAHELLDRYYTPQATELVKTIYKVGFDRLEYPVDFPPLL